MKRDTLIIIIAVVILLVAGGVYFFITKTSGTGDDTAGGKDFFSSLFPFGGGSAAPSSPGSGSGEVTTPSAPVPALRQVTDKPVVGAQFIQGKDGTLIRFIDRETGHVYDTPEDSFTVTRISHATIPRTEEVLWLSANQFMLRYLGDNEEVQNYLAKIPTTTPEQTLTGQFLTTFARAHATPSGKKMFTVTETASGSRLDSFDVAALKATTLLSSPIRSWIPLSQGENPLIQTAPSSGVPGFLYKVAAGAPLVKVLGDMPGLMASPSPTGRYILYSGASGGAVGLFMLDTKTAKTYTLPFATLAVKCAWYGEPAVLCAVPNALPQVPLPDSWLMGSVSFEDSLWAVNPETGVVRSINALSKTAETAIDAIHLSLDPRGEYALFMNKNDLTLWALKLPK